ncbi:MAG: hypothetical protein AVDCRST_MAG64-1667, partial [uncultured Phycisphaerae bacterium]
MRPTAVHVTVVVILLSGLGGPLFGGVAPATSPPAIDFVRDVRPILEAHCYACHGP